MEKIFGANWSNLAVAEKARQSDAAELLLDHLRVVTGAAKELRILLVTRDALV